MKIKVLLWSVYILIYAVWVYIVYLMNDAFGFDVLLMAAFLWVFTMLIIYCIMAIVWRIKNGVDVFATLETDPEAVKKHMLYIMRYGHEGGMVGTFKEINKIFRNYPQWRLQDWEVFRAWYKHEIDHMLKFPDVYGLTMKADGSPYSTDKDPLYDPKAPDWEQFDRKHYYGYEDDCEDDDDYTNQEDEYAASFGAGIGFGYVINGQSCDGDDGDGSDMTL